MNGKERYKGSLSTNGGTQIITTIIDRSQLKDLTKGKNRLKIEFTYLGSITETKTIDFEVETKPFEIFLDNELHPYYYNEENISLNITIYSDSVEDEGYFYYSINDRGKNSINYKIDSHYQQINSSIPITDLSKGEYTIKMWVEGKSNTISRTFKVFQTPNFRFDFIGDNKYKYKSQQKLTGNIALDIEDGDFITIKSKINNMNSYMYNKSFSSSVRIEYLEYVLPQGFRIGEHYIAFILQNNHSWTKTYTFPFTIISNPPKITSAITNKRVYFNNDNIIASISYEDYDAEGQITIFYEIEGTTESNAFNLESGKQTHEIRVNIPNNLKPGLHNISFWAQHLNDTSDKIIANFTYAKFSVDIKLTNKKITTSDSVIHANCSINYSLEDNISISFKFDNYNYHEYGNTTKFNEYQLLDIPIQKLSSRNHSITFKFISTQYGVIIIKLLIFIVFQLPSITFQFLSGSNFRNKIQKEIIGKYSFNVDEEDNISMYYKYDTENEYNLYRTSMMSVIDEEFKVELPQNIQMGNHSLEFYMQSIHGFNSTKSFQFAIVPNPPSIEATIDKPVYTKNIDPNIKAVISYNDSDCEGKIDVFYSFNKENKINFTSFDIVDDITHAKNVLIPLSKLSNGTHTLEIWAIDNFNQRSPIIPLSFEYFCIRKSVIVRYQLAFSRFQFNTGWFLIIHLKY